MSKDDYVSRSRILLIAFQTAEPGGTLAMLALRRSMSAGTLRSSDGERQGSAWGLGFRVIGDARS